MRKKLRWLLATVVIGGLTITSGLMQGAFTHRWDGEREAVVLDLSMIPKEIGPWRMVSEPEVTEETVDILEATGWVQRTYVNNLNGGVVTLVIVAGPHGPISVHVPEICYSSQDYEQQGQREVFDISPHSFWRTRFRTNDLQRAKMDSFYAWSDGASGWLASGNPRIEFAGTSTLYKIQIAVATAGNEELSRGEAGKVFLVDFLKNAWPPPVMRIVTR